MMLCSCEGDRQQLEKTLHTHKVKCLDKVDESDIEKHLLLKALLLELLNGENHIHCGPLAPKAALGFWVDVVCEDLEPD